LTSRAEDSQAGADLYGFPATGRPLDGCCAAGNPLHNKVSDPRVCGCAAAITRPGNTYIEHRELGPDRPTDSSRGSRDGMADKLGPRGLAQCGQRHQVQYRYQRDDCGGEQYERKTRHRLGRRRHAASNGAGPTPARPKSISVGTARKDGCPSRLGADKRRGTSALPGAAALLSLQLAPVRTAASPQPPSPAPPGSK
jgi:hypothetical protein